MGHAARSAKVAARDGPTPRFDYCHGAPAGRSRRWTAVPAQPSRCAPWTNPTRPCYLSSSTLPSTALSWRGARPAIDLGQVHAACLGCPARQAPSLPPWKAAARWQPRPRASPGSRVLALGIDRRERPVSGAGVLTEGCDVSVVWLCSITCLACTPAFPTPRITPMHACLFRPPCSLSSTCLSYWPVDSSGITKRARSGRCRCMTWPGGIDYCMTPLSPSLSLSSTKRMPLTGSSW